MTRTLCVAGALALLVPLALWAEEAQWARPTEWLNGAPLYEYGQSFGYEDPQDFCEAYYGQSQWWESSEAQARAGRADGSLDETDSVLGYEAPDEAGAAGGYGESDEAYEYGERGYDNAPYGDEGDSNGLYEDEPYQYEYDYDYYDYGYDTGYDYYTEDWYDGGEWWDD